MDFAGQRNSRGTVALNAAGKKKLRGRVGAFLQRRRLAEKVARPASAASLALKDPGLPNLHQMRALDKTFLESWSLDLSKFRAAKPVKALTGTALRGICVGSERQMRDLTSLSWGEGRRGGGGRTCKLAHTHTRTHSHTHTYTPVPHTRTRARVLARPAFHAHACTFCFVAPALAR